MPSRTVTAMLVLSVIINVAIQMFATVVNNKNAFILGKGGHGNGHTT